MIIGIFNTTLAPTSNSEDVITSIEVTTNIYSQEPSPVGDPVNGVQPVEYLEEYVIESDTFTYSVPAEDQAAGKIADDYWTDIAQQTRYKRFVGDSS